MYNIAVSVISVLEATWAKQREMIPLIFTTLGNCFGLYLSHFVNNIINDKSG